MVVFLYNVPDVRSRGSGSHDLEVFANFESDNSIKRLIDHVGNYIPNLTGLNIDDADWPDKIGGERVFNYTYAFGLLRDSTWPTFVLEAMRIDYVGARPEGLYLSANKSHVSDLMRALGFLCPRQVVLCSPITESDAERTFEHLRGCEYLVLKPAYEESSVGLTLLANQPDEIRSAVSQLYDRLPGAMLLQEYVAGLDVTVPMVGRARPYCLPAVVLQHDKLPHGPFIFDANLKATKSSVHYTPISDWPKDLREVIYRMSLSAFNMTKQRDYSRMDCRVAPDGRCYFLEINANPQLGLDKASFAVSAEAAGFAIGEVVRSMIYDEALPYGPSPFAANL